MIKPIINGEQPIENAPLIKLDSGASCIPQHYLSYCHTLSTIEQTILKCDFDDNYLILAGQDLHGLYVQIGIIGFDTYKAPQSQKLKKIVYGRRWRIEAQFPTSELIQTIYLAIKKAREHEVRERLKLQINGIFSAPFSSHQDLPLICDQFENLSSTSPLCSFERFRRSLSKITNNIQFDHAAVQLLKIEKRHTGQMLIDVKLAASEWSEFPETHNAFLTIIIDKPSVDLFFHALMDALIKHSDDYVAENFYYDLTPRFSKRVSPLKLADLSLQVRQKLTEPEHLGFYVRLAEHNENVDRLRAPKLLSDGLSKSVAQKLARFDTELNGFLPHLYPD